MKRGSSAIWLGVSIGLVVLLIGMMFFFYALAGKDYGEKYSSNENNNPVINLSNEQAIERFDESFVKYLLVEIKAYNLHRPPLSNELPSMKLEIGPKVYFAKVDNGEIIVSENETKNVDIIISTSIEESVKMLRNSAYISESFSSGDSRITLLADKTTLFGKGYLKLYTELTGKSITGNVVRIYVS